MEDTKESVIDFFSYLVYDIFLASFFVYSVSFFLEFLVKGIVVNYVNLNIVLIICFFSGFCSVVRPFGSTSSTIKFQ